MIEETQHNGAWRRIRSFVRREGRLTVGQETALKESYPIYGVEYAEQAIDFNVLFERDAPTVLEIGFGNGASLLEMATADPEKNYLGIEVHRPGVGNLLIRMEQQKIQNLRVMCADAILVLKHMIPDASLDTVQLFFPDPWNKRRHHKRRIVQAEFIKIIHQKLISGGLFHMATDVKDYAQHMMTVMCGSADFSNCAKGQPLQQWGFNQEQFVERPESRPLTKFEQRGQNLGHGVWDLMFKKN